MKRRQTRSASAEPSTICIQKWSATDRPDTPANTAGIRCGAPGNMTIYGGRMSRDPVVLFVRDQSHYKVLGLDCYDRRRDARTFAGTRPVIAHPPCRTWGNFRFQATSAPADEHELGPWAVEQVRRCGGVLEHPAGSTLFQYCGCPEPDAYGPNDEHGGFTVDVDQYNWGHRARKLTRLYIVGLPLYWATTMKAGEPSRCISQGHGVKIGHPKFKSRVPQWEREATPPAFAEWLIELARHCTPPRAHDAATGAGTGLTKQEGR
jgi:hypothetical protein